MRVAIALSTVRRVVPSEDAARGMNVNEPRSSDRSWIHRFSVVAPPSDALISDTYYTEQNRPLDLALFQFSSLAVALVSHPFVVMSFHCESATLCSRSSWVSLSTVCLAAPFLLPTRRETTTKAFQHSSSALAFLDTWFTALRLPDLCFGRSSYRTCNFSRRTPFGLPPPSGTGTLRRRRRRVSRLWARGRGIDL